MAKKAPTKAEREYIAIAVGRGCLLCEMLGYRGTPAEWHHRRTGTGAGQRAAHTDGIPLCPPHHRGDDSCRHPAYQGGLHSLGRKRFEREYGITEVRLVELTQARVKNILLGEMAARVRIAPPPMEART